ncbi:SRPBCC domain-containing protein [Nocardioides sp.]|uniref:SRPBCC family protein n=1 Tax=Nocardioides sp. TaxID=35761 RepID=UPI001A2BB53D|nr:SRPBCC domain-containing protein [Nocardioides sp.]MBJ7356030.1 SRPBCC domain-containing protein [Nocardioides sp.]
MVDILHRVGVTKPPADVYAALTTLDGLAAWWTGDTTGDPGPGGVVRFRFGGAPEPAGFDMSVVEAVPDKLVLWEVVHGPEEWIGTTVRFELSQDAGWTIVLFHHAGWKEPVEFMHHCSTKWATFLLSLKESLETGAGAPWPHDVKVDNWN